MLPSFCPPSPSNGCFWCPVVYGVRLAVGKKREENKRKSNVDGKTKEGKERKGSEKREEEGKERKGSEKREGKKGKEKAVPGK